MQRAVAGWRCEVREGSGVDIPALRTGGFIDRLQSDLVPDCFALTSHAESAWMGTMDTRKGRASRPLHGHQ
jgi:hypothetical protein